MNFLVNNKQHNFSIKTGQSSFNNPNFLNYFYLSSFNLTLFFQKNKCNIYFLNSKGKFNYFFKIFKKSVNKFNLIFLKYFKFSLFKFSFIIGLGYKRKISILGNYLYLYLGDRHWLIIPVPKNILILPIKKRSFILFTNYNIDLKRFLNLLKNLKFENFYKIKGIFLVRSFRRWLNVRYIKIKYLITKLSKRQKLI